MNRKALLRKLNFPTSSEDQVFWNLRRYGAPFSRPGKPGPDLSLEETLARALPMARRFPFVASGWPVTFARNANLVDWDTLESLARQSGHGNVLGFFAAVLGALTGKPGFQEAEERLADTKSETPELFFLVEQNPRHLELAHRRNPEEAARWGFVMATTLDDFRQTFRTFMP